MKMIPFANRIEPNFKKRSYSQLKGVEILWDWDYYDGPLDGLAKWKDKYGWFRMGGNWWYWFYELTPEEVKKCEKEKDRHLNGPHDGRELWDGPDFEADKRPLGWFDDAVFEV